jgi:hypothetical protein
MFRRAVRKEDLGRVHPRLWPNRRSELRSALETAEQLARLDFVPSAEPYRIDLETARPFEALPGRFQAALARAIIAALETAVSEFRGEKQDDHTAVHAHKTYSSALNAAQEVSRRHVADADESFLTWARARFDALLRLS